MVSDPSRTAPVAKDSDAASSGPGQALICATRCPGADLGRQPPDLLDAQLDVRAFIGWIDAEAGGLAHLPRMSAAYRHRLVQARRLWRSGDVRQCCSRLRREVPHERIEKAVGVTEYQVCCL